MYEKKTATVLGTTMAYLDVGEGDPIVFLHGNPTSSYVWRNIIPHVAGRRRAIAPDLIGMGDSAKLPGTGDARYRFVEHRRHLDALLDQLGVAGNVVLVVHDWGSALGFDWARRHPDAVAGIAYMEAIVRPYTWAGFGESGEYFRAWRSAAGEELVLEQNAFVEGFLPAGVLRALSDAELAEYQRPFRTPGEDRRPTLTWPREVPIDGEPADVHAVVEEYSAFLPGTDIPKLFVNAEPGMALTGDEREFARTFKNQTEITVSGLHSVQEDAPDEIGAALSRWLDALDGRIG
ncbi:haloalkane dehalogenase [Streptomyces halobius]|uniref:Haloalkane dehalogenase n=1 Tax=Streptomyces halobius TaxID=2879846 RepID=A0ABY4MIH6_9ACTN|nr:haloalkane dehalogenase [Streptomyces halobius]UQA97440.1 haloalkane dehalogenase [Streptomyces halobius]